MLPQVHCIPTMGRVIATLGPDIDSLYRREYVLRLGNTWDAIKAGSLLGDGVPKIRF